MLKMALMILSLIGAMNARANSKSICGEDDRIPSDNPKVARALGSLSDPGGCTVTMISRTCAISAGHCKDVLGVAEFNTPESRDGRIQHPRAEDIYEIEKTSINMRYTRIGDDWAVMRLKANAHTGAYAGDRQGHYEVAFEMPKKGDQLRITGYGLDRPDPTRNLAQQTHTGFVTQVGSNGSNSSFSYDVDTMGGNSGSSIIRMSDNKIVGIHTNGGCYTRGGQNSGTVIAAHKELSAAIRSCLAAEEAEGL